MLPANSSALHELACLNGVQTSYLDMNKKSQDAAPETLRAVLAAMEVPAANAEEIQASLRSTALRRWQRCVEPVCAGWDNRPLEIALRLPARCADRQIQIELQLEDGTRRMLSPGAARARQVKVAGESFTTRRMRLPKLPFGYHQLIGQFGKTEFRSLIISAPSKAYSPEKRQKEWGAFVPAYALHSEESWGAGNFKDWQQFSRWIASHGGTVAATLPLLATFLDYPACEPSPYSPASRLFWNSFYLNIPEIPEFHTCAEAQRLVGSAGFQNQLRSFRKSELIDYRAQWAARRKVLEQLARCFFASNSARRAQFNEFLKARPEVEDYAAFRAACDKAKASWHHWPQRMREGRLRTGDYDEPARRFHLYVQWLAHEQVGRLLDESKDRGVKLYLDLPLGVNSDGYDAWRERESFALKSSAGAPPDPYFTRGQNWGFTPLHPQHIRRNGYRYVLDFLRFQMRHTGLLRIDHVMALHRLYWIPDGFPASHGAYVTYPAEELHAIFNLESHRHKTTLVGENLGTVPPEVNEGMKRHGLREMFVVQYEQQPDARRALRPPPALSVASLNTHDMPPFAAHWKGEDIGDRHSLGLIPKQKLGGEYRKRERTKAALVRFLVRQNQLKKGKENVGEVLRALVHWLGASHAELVLLNLEDLWLETNPQNVPGTSKERPNWRRLARLSLEELVQNREIATLFQQISKVRSK